MMPRYDKKHSGCVHWQKKKRDEIKATEMPFSISLTLKVRIASLGDEKRKEKSIKTL